MSFRYVRKRVRLPIPSLPGRMLRPKTLIPFSLMGPSNSFVGDGLLDTGADDTVFEEWVAGALGLNLTNAPQGEAQGIGGVTTPVRYAIATFRISDGSKSREWDAWVAFAAVRLRQPLLGYAGFLQFFDAHFFGQREEVELTVNGLFPVRPPPGGNGLP